MCRFRRHASCGHVTTENVNSEDTHGTDTRTVFFSNMAGHRQKFHFERHCHTQR